jgi:hypothetical protein
MAATVRRTIEVILMLAGLLALPVAWMQYRDSGLKSAVEPPWSVRTLDDFRKWRPQYDQAVKVESRGSVHYLILGEKARTLASGPSGYVFDARGNFVGWILDTGDERYLRIGFDNDARKSTLGAAQIVISPPPAAVDARQ